LGGKKGNGKKEERTCAMPNQKKHSPPLKKREIVDRNMDGKRNGFKGDR